MRIGAFAAGCVAALAASTLAQTNVTLNMQVGGKTRNSVVHVPAGIDKPPVVFFVHGANGSGSGFQRETRGDATADREKFIAVYPSASANGGAGVWDDMRGTGNFPFFLAILDTLDARYKIDRNRVYMTGFSQGGFISFAAACFYSDVFAAVAPVSGHAVSPCTLKRPVPVHMTFGSNEGAPSFVQDLNLWRGLNNCPSTPPTITRPYPASNPSSRVTQVRHGPCEGGTSVVMDSISGQGHQWPGSNNIVQADEVWSFFKQYSLDQSTRVHPPGTAGSRAPFSISYASGVVRIDGLGEDARVRVTDARGRRVADAAARHGRYVLRDPPRGVYLIAVSGSGGAVSRKFLVP